MDKETKLLILSLLSVTDDPKKEEEILRFLFAWENTEAASDKILIQGLETIMTSAQDQELQLELSFKKETTEISDELHKEKRIEELRQHIQKL
ncbi:MAG: hypothetical protein P8J32_03185 [bacterium]|jgi:hypothetical protein|nr:hypothetical protein [bacterium]